MYVIPVERTANDIGTKQHVQLHVLPETWRILWFYLVYLAVSLHEQELRIGRQLAAVGFEYVPLFYA